VTRVGVRSCDCCGSIIDDGRLVIEQGELVINREFQAVSWRGQKIRMTSQQFQCLELLVLRSGRLVPRYSFFISILDEDCDDKQLDVIVCRLRDKFKKVDPEFDRLSTIWGRGFTWLRPDQERLAA
jgi:DNA-binding response OmpR family regulator